MCLRDGHGLELESKPMTFRVILEFDQEAGCYSAVCPELPGCTSDGETEEEARRNIVDAIDLYLEPSEFPLHGERSLD